MNSTITRRSDDGLSEKLWEFRLSHNGVILTFYKEGERETKRHAFRGPKWDAFNVRCSELSRPSEIPTDVLQEAIDRWKEVYGTPIVYIGWENENHVYGVEK